MAQPAAFDDQALGGLSAQRLAGDASGREYSRLRLPDGNTVVKMDVHHPFDADKDDWLVLRRYLESCGVPVPGLIHASPEKGVLYLEDCGDELLEHRATHADKDRLMALYRRALDILLLIQTAATNKLEATNPAAQRKFDAEKYLWELDHTATYYIKGYLGKTLSARDEARLAGFFRQLIEPILAAPMVFSHRDYHARNLMLAGDRFIVIDFQDARRGPPHYDLASLLFDSYVRLEEGTRGSLLAYYLGAAAKTVPGYENTDAGTFTAMLYRVSLQRNLKALGTFGYQAAVKQNALYTRFMPDTVGYVTRNIERFGDLADDAGFVLSLLAR